MAQSHLYLFAHLPKSAGTSLRHHFEKNISARERLHIFPGSTGCGVHHFKPKRLIRLTRQFCQNLSPKKQQKLSFIYSHNLRWNIDQLLNSPKEPYYFTFLRDPAKRMISLYNYYRGWYERELPNRKDKKIYHNRFLVDGQSPDFKTWFENIIQVKDLEKQRTKPLGLCTTTEYYQKLGYLEKGPLNEIKLKQFLAKFNFIGFTQTFADDSLYLYHLWGVKKFFKKRNVSTKFVSLETHPELKSYLKTKLVDDYQLYQYAWNWKQNWLGQHLEFNTMVAEMRLKQQAVWCHQLVFDWPANFHRFSSQLRKWLPLYALILDRFKLLFATAADKFRPTLTKFGLEPTDKQL